jgi:hypothetical protein
MFFPGMQKALPPKRKAEKEFGRKLTIFLVGAVVVQFVPYVSTAVKNIVNYLITGEIAQEVQTY